MISFFVPGQPGTKGSHRAFWNAKAGRAIVVNDSKKAAPWASLVTLLAREAMAGAPLFDGPIEIAIAFHLPRPKSHYLRGKLRATAPSHAPTKPDGDKLERCTWDALTGVVFTDDARIVRWSGEKPYAIEGRTGAQITVGPVEGGR